MSESLLQIITQHISTGYETHIFMGAGVPIECDPTELGTFGTNVPPIPELIAEGALAVQQGLTVMDIATTIHAHPTLSEIMLEASQKAAGS